MTFQISIPDLATASDQDMHRLFPSFDGRWSELTGELLRTHGTTRLSLNDNWASVSQDWCCPVCARPKVQLARLSAQGVLLCRLHWHHDHLQDRAEKILRRCVTMLESTPERAARFSAVSVCKTLAERFFPLLVCEDCNTADGVAKVRLKGCLHPDFSFSPTEITRFIIVAPNRPHEIDEANALAIWEAASDDVADRLAFVDILADRILAGRHRKEGTGQFPHQGLSLLADSADAAGSRPYAVHGLRQDFSQRSIQDDAAGTSLKVKARRKVRIPTLKYLEDFNASQFPDADWFAPPEDWRCAACDRTRFQMLRLSNKNEWTAGAHKRGVHIEETRPEALHFRTGHAGADRVYRDETAVYICKDCRLIITDTKKAGVDLTDDCLTVADVRLLMTDVPFHQRPEYDKAKAAALAIANRSHMDAVSALQRLRSLSRNLAYKHGQLVRAAFSKHEASELLAAEIDDDHLDVSEKPAFVAWLVEEEVAFAVSRERDRWPRP